MKYNYLNIIGLMTGTSMDGIDVSYVSTNGEQIKRLDKNHYHKYENKIKDILLKILIEGPSFNLKQKNYLDDMVTEQHFEALKNFEPLIKTDLIGFHGQTIYHNPDKKYSIQLGNPKKLAHMLGKDVVFDFRSKDIKMGGQGAPLAPIYHKLLIENLNLEFPSCILNIGGVSNLTYWDGKKLIGFDTGPGNALMDTFIQKVTNYYYDENGLLASKGVSNRKIIQKYICHDFFKKLPPKSLDKNSFLNFYNELLKYNLSIPDTMATLADFTIISIMEAFSVLPKKAKTILVTGGGYRNKYLMKKLKDNLDIYIMNEKDSGVNFDYVESELIAFLTARSIYNLPITFPSTTGTSKEVSGGILYKSS